MAQAGRVRLSILYYETRNLFNFYLNSPVLQPNLQTLLYSHFYHDVNTMEITIADLQLRRV